MSDGGSESADAFGELLGELVGGLDVTPVALATGARFEIIRALGEGGFGTVYEAHDKRDDRRVALKVLRRANADALLRFKREFRSLADVVHPNLVRLYELLQVGDRWMLTMELIDGEPFDRYVAAHPDQLRSAFGQLVAALSALHAGGKLHRDIKPSNVMVAGDGRVVVLDFGLVRELAADGSTILAGTPHYMSPEQCAGQTLDAASDWYAMGVMLYKSLSGSLPFEGNALEVLNAKRTRDAPPLSAAGDLEDLAMRMLRREPTMRPNGDEVAAGFEVSVPSQRFEERPFVGRETELAALDEALAAVAGGGPVSVFVRGPSGMGKSALVERFVASAADKGAIVFTGRCYERESVPYKALDGVVDALSAYLKRLPAVQAAALMPRGMHELVRVFPVLAGVEVVDDVPRRSQHLDQASVRRRAFVALKELLGAIGDKCPLIVAVDDLQWGDADSAQLLAELVGPPEPPRMLLLASYRSEEAESSALLTELGRSYEPDRELCVAALTAEQATRLAKELLRDNGSDALAASLAGESEGHPLFLQQLVEHIESLEQKEAAAISLGTVICAGIKRLPESAVALLEIVAVTGRPTSQRVVLQAANIRPSNGHFAVETLRSRGWVRTQGMSGHDAIDSYHDRIRKTVTSGLSPQRLAKLHLDIAEALVWDQSTDPEALARHFVAAGERERAVPHAIAAAQQAESALAFDHAADWYARVLALAPSIDSAQALRERLAEALANGGRGREAAQAFLDAAGGESSNASGVRALRLQQRAVEELVLSGHYRDGIAMMKPLLRELGVAVPTSTLTALASVVFRDLQLRARGIDFESRDETSASPVALVRVDLCLAVAAGLMIYDTVLSFHFVFVGAVYALRAGEPKRAARALAYYGWLVSNLESGKRRSDVIIDRAERIARSTEDPVTLGWCAMARGGVLFSLDASWAEARACFEDAVVRLSGRGGSPALISTARFFLTYCLWRQGEVREATHRGGYLMRDAQGRGDKVNERYVEVYTFCQQDRASNALDSARERLARWETSSWPAAELTYCMMALEVALQAGDHAAVPSLCDRIAKHERMMRAVHIWNTERVASLGNAWLATWDGSARHLARIEKLIQSIKKVPSGYSRGVQASLGAGIAARRGHHQRAADFFDEAEAGYETSSMKLHAASCRRRRGEILGGSEGRALIRHADAVMTDEGIVAPEQFAQSYAPRFELP